METKICKMVKTCCVYKCRNRANSVARAKNISFFRFPANKRKLQAWIKAVNRRDWEPNNHTHVCSEHFVFGWHSDEPSDVNFAPTIFPNKEGRKNKAVAQETVIETATTTHETYVVELDNQQSRLTESNDLNLEVESSVISDQQADRLKQEVETEQESHDPLKDHLYCKQLPWPGKKQTKIRPTKAKTSRELAAETLLTLCEMPVHVSKNS